MDQRYHPSYSWTPGQPPNATEGKPPPPLPPRPPDMMDSKESPPPVPTTPRPNIPKAEPIKTHKYPGKDEVFSLPELVAQHQDLFPLKIIVVKGHYGDRGEDSAIATDEIYNIHFVKKSKVFTVKDNVGNKYIVPLNSACKFGLYHQKGTCCFDTVEDVMKSSPLPQLIAAQCNYYGGSEKNCVSRLEILVVKGIIKGRMGRKPSLNVYSITKNQDKQLSKDVLGRFTTDPSYTHMYLSDLVRHVPYKFPLEAHLYPEYDNDSQGSNYMLSSEKMTLVNEFVETSIVTSPILDEEENSTELNEHVVDIPLSLPIDVSVLPPDEDDENDDYEQLYEATRTLITGYNPVLGKTFRDNADEYSYTTQTQVFSAVRKGFENEGLKIEMPSLITSSQRPDPDSYETIDTRPRLRGNTSTDKGSGEKRRSWYQPLIRSPSTDEYQSMDQGHANSRQSSLSPSRSFDTSYGTEPAFQQNLPAVPPRRATTRDTSKDALRSIPPIVPKRASFQASSADGVFLAKKKPYSPVSSDTQGSTDSISHKMRSIESMRSRNGSIEMQRQIDSLTSTVQILQNTCMSLSNEISGLRNEVESLNTQVNELSSASTSSTKSRTTDNTTLQGLSCDQVSKLLEAMGPSIARHKERFHEEFIDGDLLSQCTDEILETDLGVAQKLDRLKLMQVIDGEKSIESIMQGSYVQFEFNSGAKSQ